MRLKKLRIRRLKAHLLSDYQPGAEVTLFYAKNMINTLFGTKKGMTSTYDARGRRAGATMVEVTPNLVTQVKSAKGEGKSDGYDAIQLGYGTKKSVKKPQIGHAKKAGLDQKIRWFREVRTEETTLQPGTEINLSQVFSIGDAVKVTGTSKGKGFQGGVRRHGFHGGPKTHGQSDRHRAPGSIGTGTTPGRVLKGKRMAGHMGVDTVSTKNLEIVGIKKEENLLLIKGAIPGHVGGLIRIEKLGRIKGYTPPPEEKEDEEESGESVEASPTSSEQSVSESVTDSVGAENTEASETVVEEQAAPEAVEGEENAS